MAKKKPNRAPLFAFLGVSVLVLAGLGLWVVTDLNRKAVDDKAAAAIVPKLPAGRAVYGQGRRLSAVQRANCPGRSRQMQ